MSVEHMDFGVVPVRRQGTAWEFFVVQHQTGHWAFPKGHQEPGETNEQTARRELAEETGIATIDLHLDQTFTEDYRWEHQGVTNHKVVTYFLGLVEAADIVIQKSELADGRWIPADEVEEVLTFSESQKIFRNALKYLRQNHLWE